MKRKHLFSLVAASFAVIALALAVGSAAQAPPEHSEHMATKNAPAGRLPGHDMHSTRAAGREPATKEECPAMMAEMQEMRGRVEASDARLEELVAAMQAAKDSKVAGALEEAMAAVINELVAERRASHAMMAEIKSESGAREMPSGKMHGAKGSTGCPMMRMGMTHEAEPKGENHEH